jgi:hypothetical protein
MVNSRNVPIRSTVILPEEISIQAKDAIKLSIEMVAA